MRNVYRGQNAQTWAFALHENGRFFPRVIFLNMLLDDLPYCQSFFQYSMLKESIYTYL